MAAERRVDSTTDLRDLDASTRVAGRFLRHDGTKFVGDDDVASAADLATETSARQAADTALTTAVAGKLAKSGNLSDLTDASAARGNLGLGTAATQAASAFAAAVHTHTTSQIADLGSWTGSTALVTLGTVTTGTWHGSVLGPAYLGTGTRDGTKYLRDDGTWQPVSGGAELAIGADVTGGTAGDVLYVGPGGVLAQATGLTFDATAGRLERIEVRHDVADLDLQVRLVSHVNAFTLPAIGWDVSNGIDETAAIKFAIGVQRANVGGIGVMRFLANNVPDGSSVNVLQIVATLTAAGWLGLGLGFTLPSDPFHLYNDSTTQARIETGNAGASASFTFLKPGQQWTLGVGPGDGTANFNLYNAMTGAIPMSVTASGSLLLGSGAVATTATNGFLYLPTCAGTPTGTPTGFTGRVPLVVDSAGERLWVYVGGSWKSALLS
jgi:hypothetical protein